jgi:pectin methylesterase-like acyl-CoA thioesterase/lysophospholipase L1-like esterase
MAADKNRWSGYIMKNKLLKNISKVLAAVMTLSAVTVGSPVIASASTTISVGKGSGYDFNSLSAAVSSIKTTPTEKNPVNIYVDKGVYEETVTIDKPYINIIGKGKPEETVITYDKANGHEDSAKNVGTDKSATMIVSAAAKGFSAKNITVRNSYNIDNDTRKQTQAVAFESLADKVVLEDCRFEGRQDTLYLKGASKGQSVYGSANSARVYVKDCYVEGTVDFIFGDATAYFDNCKLFMAYYENGGHFTAPNTTLFNIGYVFNGCELTVDSKYTETLKNKIDLGRPWQCDASYPNAGSQAVYINCKLPSMLSDSGFSLWDSATVANKTRFMEYGSKSSDSGKISLDNRADYVKELTKEQAEAYNAYNVLRGSDNWNPAKASTSNLTAADITLDSYQIQLPLGESTELNATVLPAGAKSEVTYKSDSDCVKVEGNKITAVKSGSAKVYAEMENGLSAYAEVTVTAAKTPAPEVNTIKINAKNEITVGSKLTASYSFQLDSDNKADQSLISWYALKNGQTVLLKRGVGDYYKTYTVQNSDVGAKLVLGVQPATTTTYGTRGAEVTAQTATAVVKGSDGLDNYISDGFNNGVSAFTATGKWGTVNKDGNSVAVIEDTSATIESKTINSDAAYVFKLRCNPEGTGLGGDDVLNFYMNNSKDGYYRLEVKRGGNTKSLKINLYKSVNGSESALYTDEDKLKNMVDQNIGEDNPYMYISFTKSGNDLALAFRLEGSDTKLLNKTITDSEPLSSGTLKVEISGKAGNWQLDNITADAVKQIDKESQTRIYLAGDSTVKYYGDDNSIGGWGEYLVNYFDDGVDIINKGEGGRSTRSYINQGRLDEIVSEVREGDYVFIQFGHNDNRTTEDARIEHSVMLGTPDANGIYPTIRAEKTKTPQRIYDFYKDDAYPYGEYFYPYESGTFKWYLEQYVVKVKEKGGIPVIITPVCRMLFDSDGKIQPAFGENNGYKVAAEQVAAENNVTCIDAYSITQALYESYGVMTTQGLHDVKDDGTIDLTHYNKFGANIVASKLAAAIGEAVPELQSHLKASTLAVGKTDDMKTANLILVGDAGKGVNTSDIFASHGYGEYMQQYFSDKITVKDFTEAGATAKGFASTKEYSSFLDSVKEGDYVMICFGRYDSDSFSGGSSTAGVSVESQNGFYYNLYNSYVKPVSDRGAIPVLLTPVNNRAYNAAGEAVETTGEYDEDVRKLVTDKSLYFVNVSSITYELYKNMGAEGSKVLNAVDSKNGIDNTALSEFGAQTLAKQIVSAMKYSSASLKNYILDDKLNAKDIFTRGEFVEKLADIIGISDLRYTANFKDIVEGKSYEKAIGAAAQLGIVKGDEQGYFYPEAVLDGESMTAMLKAALNYAQRDDSVLNDVYALANGAISNEIGLWALDRLTEAVR